MIEKRDIEEICDVIVQDIKDDRQRLMRCYENEEHVEKKGYTRSIMLIEEAKDRLVKIFEAGLWEKTRV